MRNPTIRVILYFLFIFALSYSSIHAQGASEAITNKKRNITIGIISAVPGESGRLLELMEQPIISNTKGLRTYHKGKLFGIDTVLVSSRIGKVAASATAVNLILEYNADLVVFTGVAGALDSTLNVGDVVIANALIQHDMDASPFCPTFEIPLLKITQLHPDPLLQSIAFDASNEFVTKELLHHIPREIRSEFTIINPKVVSGLVITGDRVISQESQKRELKGKLPEALCVEMEGASVGQVCYEYDIPYIVIRVISDYASNEKVQVNIKKFVQQASGYYATAIMKNIYNLITIQRQGEQSCSK